MGRLQKVGRTKWARVIPLSFSISKKTYSHPALQILFKHVSQHILTYLCG